MLQNIKGNAKALQYRIAKTIFKKKNKVGGLIFLISKTNYDATINQGSVIMV